MQYNDAIWQKYQQRLRHGALNLSSSTAKGRVYAGKAQYT
ncbi:hypothetical protein GAGA_4254 [Paraglaciecola agarilytica NO2]|uniref:Transposase n=1 Tax=Paraglaciecola agarilytica NO2 TaxID=1125747 RepID=A0ABQ0ICE3_9ALTE|nr:hypothetical protein GAGA_4254 [Paraglaciecola agarilytica NO2]